MSIDARPARSLGTSGFHTHRGVRSRLHRFEVPLIHADPRDPRRVVVAAREVQADVAGAQERPWLVYFQGGPGHPAPRPIAGPNGWMRALLPRFRILLLDQRGTGLSTPQDAVSLTGLGDTATQLEHLTHFRAPDIVADAEAIRLALGVDRWSTLGQSFGGFITLSYLSFAPHGLTRSLITGGLSTLTGDVDSVYRATYARMRARLDEVLDRHPGDRAALRRLYDVVRSPAARDSPQLTPQGRAIDAAAVQRLGMLLGGNTRVENLHYLLEGAVAGSPQRPRVSPQLAQAIDEQIDHSTAPLYWLLQEAIYSRGSATAWAAARVRDAGFPGFRDDAALPYLLGEMALPRDYEDVPALRPLEPLAHALAEYAGWGELYDLDALASNDVPVAAAVYTDDVYVDRDLSLRTAAAVRGLHVSEFADLHHDGIADDPERVIGALVTATNLD